MGDLSEQFKRMEDDMLKLAEEFVSNKTEIINLKKRLNENDRKIGVLENTNATISDQAMLKCTDVTKDETSSVVKRLESAEEEIVTLKKKLNESNQKIEVLVKAKAITEEKDVMNSMESLEQTMVTTEGEDVMKRLETLEMAKVTTEGEDVMKRLETLEKAIVITEGDDVMKRLETLEKAKVIKEGEDVMKRLEVVERECRDVTQKCQTFSKLQHLLNKVVLKSQDNSSVQIQINKLHNRIDSLTPYIAGDIKKTFEENMQKVKNHRILLNREEYVLLGALESLCDLSDKPAWQSCQKYWDDDLCYKKTEELKSKFVTHFQAMEEYNRICAINSLLFEGSYFYRFEDHRASRTYILAISAKNVLFLDGYTKKLEFTYKKDKIKHYEKWSENEILLVFQNGKSVIMDTYNHAKAIEVTFKTVMGK